MKRKINVVPVEQLSVTQYAKRVGVSRQWVLYQISRDQLPHNVTAVKIGEAWVLNIQ